MAEDMKRCSKLEDADLEKGLMISHLYCRAYYGGYPPTSWNSGIEKKSMEIGGSGYFLDSCSLCKKSLENHRDIFMYRGDIAFCSEECRQQQIERDEAEETRSCFAAKAGAARRVEENAEGAAQRIHVVAA